jgi:hypothetical protein
VNDQDSQNSSQPGKLPAGAVVQLVLRGHPCYVTLARAYEPSSATVMVNLPGGIPRRVSRFAVKGLV